MSALTPTTWADLGELLGSGGMNDPDFLYGMVEGALDIEDAHKAATAILVEALRLIAGERCQSYTDPRWACLSKPHRTRDAKYTADRWCDACIARDALSRALVDPDADPAVPKLTENPT